MKKDYFSICQLPEKINLGQKFSLDALYTLFEQRETPDFYFAGECHTAWEFIYVCEGSITATADSQVFTLRDGDVLLLKPMAYHKLSLKENTSCDLLVATFDLYGYPSHLLQNRMFHPDKHQRTLLSDFASYLRSFSSEEDKWTKDTEGEEINEKTLWHIDYVYVLQKKRKSEKELVLAGKYLELLLLSFAMSKQEEYETVTDKNALLFLELSKKLEESVYTKITIAQLAKACNTSPATAKKCFLKHAGCSIHKYLLNIKIRTAIELLKGGKSVGEVSELLQFANQNYFSFVFKRETGTCASAYKNK
ncbi:MAG: helix-turn-helix domain-containing protein [Clostridia bacterium]|nr:helix-turn-helix domain-containing protein [Clostridia bacterium]